MDEGDANRKISRTTALGLVFKQFIVGEEPKSLIEPRSSRWVRGLGSRGQTRRQSTRQKYVSSDRQWSDEVTRGPTSGATLIGGPLRRRGRPSYERFECNFPFSPVHRVHTLRDSRQSTRFPRHPTPLCRGLTPV